MILGLHTFQWNCCVHVNTHENLVTIATIVYVFRYNTIQYKFINMAAISWIKRKTITHKQRHAFKITEEIDDLVRCALLGH